VNLQTDYTISCPLDSAFACVKVHSVQEPEISAYIVSTSLRCNSLRVRTLVEPPHHWNPVRNHGLHPCDFPFQRYNAADKPAGRLNVTAPRKFWKATTVSCVEEKAYAKRKNDFLGLPACFFSTIGFVRLKVIGQNITIFICSAASIVPFRFAKL